MRNPPDARDPKNVNKCFNGPYLAYFSSELYEIFNITSIYRDIWQYSEASFIRDAFIRKHRYPDGFSREQKTQCNFAPFSRKSVFPEPDSGLGNQTMFYNDQRSVLSGHAPECH